MRKPGNGNGGPQITWTNIIATLAFLATLAGGAWLLFQSQFSNIDQQLRDNARGLGNDIRDNRTELERLRDRAILRDEHKELTKRIDQEIQLLRERLDVIEKTRPTTGEVEINVKSSEQRVDALRESVSDLRKKIESLNIARNPIEARELDAQVLALSKRIDAVEERLKNGNGK